MRIRLTAQTIQKDKARSLSPPDAREPQGKSLGNPVDSQWLSKLAQALLWLCNTIQRERVKRSAYILNGVGALDSSNMRSLHRGTPDIYNQRTQCTLRNERYKGEAHVYFRGISAIFFSIRALSSLPKFVRVDCGKLK